MIDLMKKTIFMGLGAASYAADHVKSFVDELEKKGKISREEAEKLARELAAKTSDHVKALASQLEEEGKLTKEEIEKFALGVANKTAEQMKSLVEDLEKKGKLSTEEAETYAREAKEKADSSRYELEARFHTFIGDLVKKLNLVTRTEFDALAEKVAALESDLTKMKNGCC